MPSAARDNPPSSSPPAPVRRDERLDPAVFGLPAARIRAGHHSDKYFVRARDLLLSRGRGPSVAMQFFQRRDAVVAGTDEAIAVLKLCLADGYGFGDLEVRSLRDGDRAAPWETVMLVTGPYPAFVHLETLCAGVLARRTRIATNTRGVVEAAWPKLVMYFPARHDHWDVQAGDGWAAHVAGAMAVSTDAQAAWWGSSGMGTVPHGLIAAFGGDTVAATAALADRLPEDVPLVTLVDFDNDSVGTSLAVARALGERLWGVRLDTSGTMVDRCVQGEMGDFDPRGVNPRLVHKVRDALDAAGFGHVRIVASGGFNAAKIRAFEEAGVPVDQYGVGSSLLRGSFDYTADVVTVEGRPVSKAGRWPRPNDRLERVT